MTLLAEGTTSALLGRAVSDLDLKSAFLLGLGTSQLGYHSRHRWLQRACLRDPKIGASKTWGGPISGPLDQGSYSILGLCIRCP